MIDKDKLKLSIIIVSYNTRQMTLECIRSVFEETKSTSFKLIIVDNASSDGSADAIEKEFGSKVELIKLTDNVGFAAGNNLAADHATTELVLLLNPDTIVLDEAIDRIVLFSNQNLDALIWGGKTLFADKSLNPTSCWRQITLWNIFCRSFGLARLFKNNSFFNSEQYGGWKRDTIKRVDIVTGCFLLIKTELWKKLDGFDSDFFMYGEDADLCLRARNYGANPLINPDAVIIHYGGASERIKEDKMIKLFKAKILLTKKHWGNFKYKLGKFIFLLYPLNKVITQKVLFFMGKDVKKEAFVWGAIWERRKEWLDS